MASDSASAAPTRQTVEQTSIPSYAQPYVEEMLGAARANVFKTDAQGNILDFQPYETYQSERMAQFTPLQLQAFESAQALGPSDQGVAASHIAQQAGLAGMQAATAPYQAGQFSPERVNLQGLGAYQAGSFSPERIRTQNFISPFGAQYADRSETAYQQLGGASLRDPNALSMDMPRRYGEMPNLPTPGQEFPTAPAQAAMPKAVAAQATPQAAMPGDTGYRGGMAPPDTSGVMPAARSGIPQGAANQTMASQSAAQQYMSPYMQNVVDIQQREAQRQADIAGQRQQAEAVRAGAFGGGRDAIMRAEAARNLALQKGDIQAQGLQAAYQQAQAQFNADQARQLQAAMANQQAGMTAQQFGEQSRQFGAGQSSQEQARQLQAALANQQAGMEAQRLGEQSRQYGAGFGLSGLETALRSAGTLGQLGQAQFGQELSALQQQGAFGQQQQQQVQSLLQQQYQDFLNQQRYPYQQLGFMSDMLRGLPMAQTATSLYQAPPSPVAQVAGLGTALGGASGLMGVMRAKGGPVHSSRAGLADLMAEQI